MSKSRSKQNTNPTVPTEATVDKTKEMKKSMDVDIDEIFSSESNIDVIGSSNPEIQNNDPETADPKEDDMKIMSDETPAIIFKKGAYVMITKDAVAFTTGKRFPDYAYKNVYKITNIIKDRLVLKSGLTYTIAVHKKYVQLVKVPSNKPIIATFK